MKRIHDDITVVIPVRDRAGLILRCLDSLARQTLLPARVIVVDNGSTDGTSDAVKKWSETHPEISLDILYEPVPGAARARQTGLEMVKTKFVIFFDSDDEMLPNLIERAADSIGDADLVYWKVLEIDVAGKSIIKTYHSDSLIRRQLYNSILCTVSYMARTELLHRVGGWNPDIYVWDDWELGVRIAIASPNTRPLPEVLVRVHLQENSITGTSFSQKQGRWEDTLFEVERIIRRSNLSITEKSRLLDMTDYRRMILAANYSKEGNREASKSLMSCIDQNKRLSHSKKLWLRVLFHYTRLGGRGAYYFW